MGAHFGAPSKTTSSVGSVATTMSGTGPVASVGFATGLPASSTSAAAPPSSRSADCAESALCIAESIPAGGASATFQGPARFGAASQPSKSRR